MLRILAIIVAAMGLQAATLERLSMTDMISKSSDIVRGRVVSSRSGVRGGSGHGAMVYTWYTLEVVERMKGSAATQMEVAVPGGTVRGLSQTIAGAPVLRPGDEYVFFIWTSRSGLAQIIGLVQGLLEIHPDAKGRLSASREPTAEPMLDPVTRKRIPDTGAKYGYEELKRLVSSTLAGGVDR